MQEEISALHSLSSNTIEWINEVNYVGCFQCGNKFPSEELVDFVNGGYTALCPYCDIDSVIPMDSYNDATQDMILNEMNSRYFFN